MSSKNTNKKNNGKPNDTAASVNTGGGAYVGGDVSVKGGDFVGRDKKIISGDRGISIGGNVSGSTIISGEGNVVSFHGSSSENFDSIYRTINSRTDLSQNDKADLTDEIKEFEAEIKKGNDAGESFLIRRLRNISRIAPDILEVVLATIASPTSGFGLIAKKLAEKMKTSAD